MAETVSIQKVLECLNREKVRCTYEAVADVMGGIPLGVSRQLGPRRPWASWVVSKNTGDPTDYTEDQKHPDLYRKKHVITTGEELVRCMKREVTEFPE